MWVHPLYMSLQNASLSIWPVPFSPCPRVNKNQIRGRAEVMRRPSQAPDHHPASTTQPLLSSVFQILSFSQGFLSNKDFATTGTVFEKCRPSDLMTLGHSLCGQYFCPQPYFFQAQRGLYKLCPVLVFKEDSRKFYYIVGVPKLGYCPYYMLFTVYI